ALTADGIALGSGGSLSAPNGTVTLASATPGPTLDLTTGLGAAPAGTFSLGPTAGIAAISAATLTVDSGGTGGITVTGAIALPSVDLLDLVTGGALSETLTTDSLTVGTFDANVASADLTGNNAIGTLSGFTVTAGSLSLTDTEPLNIIGTLSAVGNTVSLAITGSLSEGSAGSIDAGTLTGSSTSATLNNANTIDTLGAFSASSGGFSLTEAAGQALSVTGAVSGQTIALTADWIAIGSGGSLDAGTGGAAMLVTASPAQALDLIAGPGPASLGTFSLGPTVGIAAISAATLTIGTPSTSAISISGPVDLPGVALLDLVTGGAISEALATDNLTVGTLTADVTSANLIGNNAIGTLAPITATGSFTLADTGGLTIAGLLDAGSATVNLASGGALMETTGSIMAGTLSGNATSATLDGANSITTLGGFTVTAGSLSLTDTEPLNIIGTLSAVGNTVSLAITGSLSEGSAGTIDAGTLTGNSTSATLSNANTIDTLGAFSASVGGFSLTEAAVVPTQTLSVTGAVSVPTGQTIALTTDGLQISGSLSAPSGTVKLVPASANLPIALNALGPDTAGTLSINDTDLSRVSAATLEIGSGSAGPIVIGNSLGFPFNLVIVPNPVTSLVLESGGAISESGTLSAPTATLSGFATSASVPATGNDVAALGSFTAPGGFTFTEAGNLFLAGLIDAGSATANLTSVSGNINEDAGPPAGTITAGTLAASAAGSVVLSAANSIATLGDIAAPGGFTLDNPAGLFVAGDLNAGNATVNLKSSGALIETTGSITAGLLEGTLASATLGGANKITDIAALTAPGGFSLTNGEPLTIRGAANFGTATGSFAITGGLLENGSGILTAGLIEGSAANVSLPNSANEVGTLGAFSAPGGLTLTTANELAISGSVDTAGTAIDLTSGGSITEIAGGALIGAELAGFAGGGTLGAAAGTASFANTNTLAALGSFTALGGFTLADTGSLALLGALDSGTATVVLTGGAAVTEPTGSITATTLSGTLASASLPGANRISNLANFSAANGFSLTNLGTLTLTGPVSTGGAEAAFTLNGSLVQAAAGILSTGTLAGSATSINLEDPANAIASLGAITAPGGLTLATANGLEIAGTVATGTAPVSLTAGGAITEVSGGTLVAGALTGSADAASFANTNSIAELGSFTAPRGFTLDNAGDLPIAGSLGAGSATALLVAGGSLYETGGAITAGTLTGSAGNVSLANALNRIANLGPFAAGTFNLDDGEDLTVIGTVTGNPIGLAVTGNLALGSGAGSGVLSSSGAVFLTATAAITEPAGAIDAAILTGSAASASLPGANLVPLLGAFTTGGPFLFNAALPTLTVSGPLAAGSAGITVAGGLALAGRVAAGAVTLQAGGAITEPGGVIAAGTLSGSATAAALTAPNTIATLGAFNAPGTILLTDIVPLAVAGPVTASFFSITDSSNVSFTGATDSGTLNITALGSITEPSGTVTAALLEGSADSLAQFGPDAPAGSASITTLGPFSVTDGTFTLTDSVPLNIIGPLSANNFAIAAPGSIVLTNATITTIGLPVVQQSDADPARPGSYFDVTTPAGRFLELGRTTINPGGGPATVRIDLNPAGGLISFADLVAPTTTLILDTGAGDAGGTIDLGALIVIGNLGSSDLTGAISNLSGVVASSKATISPFQSAHYRLNSCPLMSVNCIFIAPPEVPQGNPLSGIAIVGAQPNQRDIELLLPNVAAQDY
ncbi:MAG: beta strand repeat-containing protein, partial [Acetobacteraceae bacterium]